MKEKFTEAFNNSRTASKGFVQNHKGKISLILGVIATLGVQAAASAYKNRQTNNGGGTGNNGGTGEQQA